MRETLEMLLVSGYPYAITKNQLDAIRSLLAEVERLRAEAKASEVLLRAQGETISTERARIDAALAILAEPVTPGDYGAFLMLRQQAGRAVKALKGEGA